MTNKNIEAAGPPASEVSGQGIVARGFGQTFGLLPSVAMLTLAVDTMLFGAEVGTLGAILPISCAAGVGLGVITYLSQKRYFGDDPQAAFIKALILGGLTALPSPIPWALFFPAGVVGFVHNRRRK